MSTLTCIETRIDASKNHYGCFVIEPLEAGHGITLGNALRRTLLSDLTGFAITGVRINDLKHEFATVEGLREDVLEIILNLKEIVFQSSFFVKSKKKKLKGFLNVQGPMIVTAGMFQLPKGLLKILNPDQYICTLVNSSEFYLEIDLEQGVGYRLTEEIRKKKRIDQFHPHSPSTLLVDALFMPIRQVNYKIKLIHDTQGNLKESLSFEIVTNGSLTPQRAFQESLKILMNLFYSFFLTPSFYSLSSQLATKILLQIKRKQKKRNQPLETKEVKKKISKKKVLKNTILEKETKDSKKEDSKNKQLEKIVSENKQLEMVLSEKGDSKKKVLKKKVSKKERIEVEDLEKEILEKEVIGKETFEKKSPEKKVLAKKLLKPKKKPNET
jgi:DNA-directed RNA polymerase alpha subunit